MAPFCVRLYNIFFFNMLHVYFDINIWGWVCILINNYYFYSYAFYGTPRDM